MSAQSTVEGPARSAAARITALPLNRVWRAILPYIAVVLTGMLAAWLSLLPPRDFALDIGTDGSHDVGFINGYYTRERVEQRTYRWLRGDAVISLPGGRSGPAIFTIALHNAPWPAGPPQPVRISGGPATAVFAAPPGQRVYRMLFPAGSLHSGRLALQFLAPTYSPPGDDRMLAVAVDRIALAQTPHGRPLPQLVLIQALLPACLMLALRSNRIAPQPSLLAGLAAIAILAWTNLEHRLWASAAPLPLLSAALAFAGAGLAAQRLLRPGVHNDPAGRFAWALWLVFLAGAAARVGGVLTPGFEFRDLDIQSLQFSRVTFGQVYLTVGVHEWGGARTYYPSGPYLLFLPLLLLLPSQAHALHLGAALIDACGPLLLALLARELGTSRRAGLLAAWLLAFVPMNFTAIFWGFSTNIAGQALLLLALWLLLAGVRAAQTGNHMGRRAWLLGLSLVLVSLSHIGVLLMAGPLFAVLFLAALGTAPPGKRAALSGAFLGAGAFFALTYLSLIVAPMLTQAAGVYTDNYLLAPRRLAEERAYIRSIIPVALWRGMVTLPVLAVPFGIMLLWQRRRDLTARVLLLAWPLIPLLFLLIEYLTLSQVRYVYFAGAFSCLSLAVLLERLGRSRAGRIVLLAALLLIAVSGATLWFNGAVLGYKPSLVPLTH